MFELRFGELEALVRLAHEKPPRAAVASRFRYFQRLGFPAGANTGRGRPAAYGLDQVLQTLVAFELAEVGMTPTRIVRTVRTNWPRLQRSMLKGWRASSGLAGWERREVLMLEPSTLADATRADDAFAPVEDPFEPIPVVGIDGWGRGRDGPPRLLLVDPGRLVDRLAANLPLVTAFDRDDLASAFEAYATGVAG